MADNKAVTAGALANSTWATDEISSVDYQRVKVTKGNDGVAAGDTGSWGTTTAMTFAAGLQSLASSSTAGTISAEVDLSTAAVDDCLVTVTVQMTTAGSPTGLVEVYALASLDGTKYEGDVSTYSGTEAAYTIGAAGSPNLTPLGYIKPHANTNTYRGMFSLRSAFGSVPPYFAVVIVNNSSIALHSSGNGADYRVRY